jgi:hypothetical protein
MQRTRDRARLIEFTRILPLKDIERTIYGISYRHTTISVSETLRLGSEPVSVEREAQKVQNHTYDSALHNYRPWETSVLVSSEERPPVMFLANAIKGPTTAFAYLEYSNGHIYDGGPTGLEWRKATQGS